MALTADDSIRLKAHCRSYQSLSQHFQQLDHLLTGQPALLRVDIPGRLHMILRNLKNEANYELFLEAIESVLHDLRGQQGRLHSTLKEQPPDLVDGVMSVFDAIVQDVADAVRGGDDWDHLPIFDNWQAAAREMAKEFYAGSSVRLPGDPISLEFEWYEKEFHRGMAPASWRADDHCLILRFDFMHFTYEHYLRIPFFLLHEYISHVYDLPAADCKLRRLVLDGWLLGAQQELFKERCMYDQWNAVENYLARELRKGDAACRGYHLARCFYNGIEDRNVATRWARDLVLRPCNHVGETCFHYSFLYKKLDPYKQRWKSPDELRRKAKTSPSIEDLFMVL